MNAEVTLADKRISENHLVEICKYRQGDCCKYIIFLEAFGDFYCAKNVSDLRKVIESQTGMRAKGDNCEGLLYEEK